MSQSQSLIDVLKKTAKRRGITYRDLASKMGKSEVTVKRIFAERRLTLDRLEEICTILGLTLSEATDLANQEARGAHMQFTFEQEKALAADSKLFALFYLVATHLNFEQLLKGFAFERAELIKYLVRMDKLKMIELHPHQKFKLKVPINLKWIDRGPLMKTYGDAMKTEFVSYPFERQGEFIDMYTSYLSEGSLKLITKALARVFSDLQQLSDVDDATRKKARRMTIMVACRPWTYSIVDQFAKSPKVSALRADHKS